MFIPDSRVCAYPTKKNWKEVCLFLFTMKAGEIVNFAFSAMGNVSWIVFTAVVYLWRWVSYYTFIYSEGPNNHATHFILFDKKIYLLRALLKTPRLFI